MNVTEGVTCSFAQQAVVVDPEHERYVKLGNVHKTVVAAPDLDEAFGELGQAYYETGQIVNAIKAFEDAVKINPSNPIHLSNLNVLKAANLP